MRKRKSPYEHPVSAHVRSGIQVSNYRRGKGHKPRSPPKKWRRNPPINAKLKTDFRNFNVTVKFIRGRSESIPSVSASTFGIALTKGLAKRSNPEPAKSVLIRRIK